MSKIIHLMKDTAYQWFDMKPVDDILENGPSISAKVIEISDEDWWRYQQHLEESQYWQEYFEKLNEDE